MGTKFFTKGPKSFGPSNLNMEARALSSGNYAGRAAAGNAAKDLAGAMALRKANAFKPQSRSAAYPKGPKV